MTCRCKVCVFSRKVELVKTKLTKHDAKIIEELLLKWEHSATDATYYKMRLNGTWPSNAQVTGAPHHETNKE